MGGKETQEKGKAQDKAQEFDLEEWLKEGYQGLRQTLKGPRRVKLLPEEFWQHGRAARKEMLLAVRSLLDDAIQRLEGEGKADSPGTATQQGH